MGLAVDPLTVDPEGHPPRRKVVREEEWKRRELFTIDDVCRGGEEDGENWSLNCEPTLRRARRR